MNRWKEKEKATIIFRGEAVTFYMDKWFIYSAPEERQTTLWNGELEGKIAGL